MRQYMLTSAHRMKTAGRVESGNQQPDATGSVNTGGEWRAKINLSVHRKGLAGHTLHTTARERRLAYLGDIYIECDGVLEHSNLGVTGAHATAMALLGVWQDRQINHGSHGALTAKKYRANRANRTRASGGKKGGAGNPHYQSRTSV